MPHGHTDRTLAEACWEAVGGDRDVLRDLEVTKPEPWLGGPLAVDELAVAAIGAGLLAAAELAECRGLPRPRVSLSAEHAAVSFRSERHALLNGQPVRAGFAPLSRFVSCRDGWLRTHANYPHHARALVQALGFRLSDDPQRLVQSLQRATEDRTAESVEEAIVAAGGCAAAVRSEQQWGAHPAGRAVAEIPLVARESSLATSASRSLRGRAAAGRPAAGVRVLDLTRVIAGPVAGRTLAALGADVLRVDPPQLPEIPEQHLDTGAGKRSALLHLADEVSREALLAGADVILLGYRPEALTRFGLDPPSLAHRHAHLVQVSLSAWGHAGPWARRRGFDSLVQAASGIASACEREDGHPGALPAQALDHASGHLMAATALSGLAARVRGEAVPPARIALARTAVELLAAGRRDPAPTPATPDPRPYQATFGEVTLVGPPGALDGLPLGWAHGPRPWGGDAPRWAGLAAGHGPPPARST